MSKRLTFIGLGMCIAGLAWVVYQLRSGRFAWRPRRFTLTAPLPGLIVIVVGAALACLGAITPN